MGRYQKSVDSRAIMAARPIERVRNPDTLRDDLDPRLIDGAEIIVRTRVRQRVRVEKVYRLKDGLHSKTGYDAFVCPIAPYPTGGKTKRFEIRQSDIEEYLSQEELPL